jgi:cell division protein FtsQ
LSTRAARMKIYNELIRQLDSEGAHYSQDLSEVDITDQEDVKVLANDPAGAVLVHLGSSDFLSRYKIYVTHLRAWRQQFDKLESVDLRYEHQIIVNPDMQNAAKAPQLTPAAAKAAMAAGVKPTALIHVVTTKPTPAATTAAKPAAKAESLATEKATQKSLSKPSAKKVMHRRPKHRTTARKTVVAKTKTPANAMVPTEPHPQRAPTSTPPKAASSTSKRAALNKKKPSAAVAKNQVQQDRP